MMLVPILRVKDKNGEVSVINAEDFNPSEHVEVIEAPQGWTPPAPDLGGDADAIAASFSELQDTLSARDKEISELRESLKTKDEEISELRESLKVKQEEIFELQESAKAAADTAKSNKGNKSK